MHTLAITIPIFLIVLLGYILRRTGVVQTPAVHAINHIVYYVSLPSAIISAFWGVDWSSGKFLSIMLANICLLAVFGFLLLLMGYAFRLTLKHRVVLYMGALVGNTVYMGFPLAQQIFTPEQFPLFLAAALPHLIIGILFSELVALYVLDKQRGMEAYVKSMIGNPLFLSLVVGVALGALHISPEDFAPIQKTIAMLATTASPLALLALGAFMHQRFVLHDFGLEVGIAFLKTAVFPLLVLICGHAFTDASDVAILASAFASAMPTAVTVFVISDRHNIAPQLTANIIMISTLISIASLPLFISLM